MPFSPFNAFLSILSAVFASPGFFIFANQKSKQTFFFGIFRVKFHFLMENWPNKEGRIFLFWSENKFVIFLGKYKKEEEREREKINFKLKWNIFLHKKQPLERIKAKKVDYSKRFENIDKENIKVEHYFLIKPLN